MTAAWPIKIGVHNFPISLVWPLWYLLLVVECARLCRHLNSGFEMPRFTFICYLCSIIDIDICEYILTMCDEHKIITLCVTFKTFGFRYVKNYFRLISCYCMVGCIIRHEWTSVELMRADASGCWSQWNMSWSEHPSSYWNPSGT